MIIKAPRFVATHPRVSRVNTGSGLTTVKKTAIDEETKMLTIFPHQVARGSGRGEKDGPNSTLEALVL